MPIQWLEWVERTQRVRKIASSIPGRVTSETEKWTPIASLVCVHHLRDIKELVDPESV